MRSMRVSTSGLVLALLASACANGATQRATSDGGSGGSAGSGGAAGSGGTVTGPVEVSVLDAHPVLSDTVAKVHVVLSHAATEPVSVRLSTKDATATSAAGDYQPVSHVVTFAPGMTAAVVEIHVTTPYETLTLDTALSRRFETKLSEAENAEIADGDGVVTLAPAGMVIETPLAVELQDGDIVPDFNGDGAADLVLTGRAGRGSVLLTPAVTFEEAAHVVVDPSLLDGTHAFSWAVDTAGLMLSAGVVAGDQSMAFDWNDDGLSDLLVVGEARAHLLFGHTGPFFEFSSGDARLSDGTHGSALADFEFGYGKDSLQTGDYDGDGRPDFGQAGHYSSAAGGSETFKGVYALGSGNYPGVYTAAESFSYTSGTTAVGVASLSNGTRAGVRADLNGDGRDDLLFVGIAANDGVFGGNNVYVRFGDGKKLVDHGVSPAGTFDGQNGFQISNANYLSNWSNYVPQDSGDVNGDGIEDHVLLGGGIPLTVVFGKTAPFASGNYSRLEDLGAEAALFDTDTVLSARIGDLNRDGLGDVVFITENKLRVIWGQKQLTGKPIFGTQYPEMGEIDIDPASGLDSVGVVGDLDGDQTADVIVFSKSWHEKSGGALVLFGKTLTRILGGPALDVPVVR